MGLINGECEFGHLNCSNIDKRCDLCFNSLHYVPEKVKKTGIKKKADKVTGRRGANFEYENHKRNNLILSDTYSGMTPNSGAGIVKGDEEIKGLVNCVEELKTSVQTNTRGKKTFTIQKLWLDKIKREGKAANKEFWYLKFAFGDYEKTENWYAITEADVITSMVNTMKADRLELKQTQAKIDLANKRASMIDAENTKLLAEIEYLKAKIKVLEPQDSL